MLASFRAGGKKKKVTPKKKDKPPEAPGPAVPNVAKVKKSMLKPMSSTTSQVAALESTVYKSVQQREINSVTAMVAKAAPLVMNAINEEGLAQATSEKCSAQQQVLEKKIAMCKDKLIVVRTDESETYLTVKGNEALRAMEKLKTQFVAMGFLSRALEATGAVDPGRHVAVRRC